MIAIIYYQSFKHDHEQIQITVNVDHVIIDYFIILICEKCYYHDCHHYNQAHY